MANSCWKDIENASVAFSLISSILLLIFNTWLCTFVCGFLFSPESEIDLTDEDCDVKDESIQRTRGRRKGWRKTKDDEESDSEYATNSVNRKRGWLFKR